MEKVYSEFSRKELILRDHLAIDRTILTNESTFLAYLRTGLAFIAGGLALLKFFESDFSIYYTIVLGLIGLITIVVGFKRYKEMRNQIKSIYRLDKNDQD